VAWGSAHVVAWGSAHVVARDSAHVEARDSAHVVAWGSAHVEARGSAHVVARDSAHVEARDSAHVAAWGSAHVVARDSAHVEARDSAHVEASRYVAVHQQPGHSGQITGGVVIAVPVPTTPAGWCAFRGVTVKDGVAVLYKAVRDDYRSSHGLLYAPGTAPEAPDWDGGEQECGGGLHVCASPLECLEFDPQATRYVACPVALADIRPPRRDDSYHKKVKARRVCGPVVEVDRYGKPLQAAKSSMLPEGNPRPGAMPEEYGEEEA
jgi:hypothetical protein